ncbi:double-strand break repair protein AddB [Brevundimonas sp. NPDC092305]|uniref:double-strand break repair protein AddB n=1 Tax=Brevundimonas sp. NPDC092305 TaxID=3363957 RepID=UPI00380D1B75
MSGFDPFATSAPRWYAVEAHRPFLDDLAEGLLAWLGDEPPEALSDAVVLLPNRRAARAFIDGLNRHARGRTVLLPQIRPLGDLEEDEPPFAPGELDLDLPPAISPLRRRFELARMIDAHRREPVSPLIALEMAESLAAFLDSCQIEEVTGTDRIRDLAEADMARHWQDSADFLSIAVEAWPQRLTELGLIDPQARRIALLKRLAESWTERPPQHPVFAAGSTGTVPAAAAVLGAVARAPRGAVILPGLDLDLDEAAWGEVGDQHPQGALKALLTRHGVARADVALWPIRETSDQTRAGRGRRRLIAEALKPPLATADWRRAIDAMQASGDDPVGEGLAGLTVLTGRTEDATAALAALLMREAVETPGQTCALVTPDLDLARRVQARLRRWGLAADSSAGEPLSRSSIGVLMGLVANLAGGFGASPLLAILKHPTTTLDLEPAAFASTRDALEQHGLRGPRPENFDAVRRRLTGAKRPQPEAENLLTRLEEALSPMLSGDEPRSVDVAARALAEAIERLAGEGVAAWRGPEGEAASRLLSGLIEEGAAAEPLDGAAFAELLRRLMDQEVIRTGGDVHPRLRILGAIEARLVRADRMILAGLEEGVWPRGGAIDPFLSRPMRQTLGLPSPERRIGLSAHDFAQAACAPEVVLLHAERRGGQPSVKSRWLWRLDTLVRGAGRELPGRPEAATWAARLDAADPAPPPTLRPARRPAPRPPVEARPKRMSVTRVEEWVRDPYATYARFILKLFEMARPDEAVDARIRGTAIHDALHRFGDAWETDGAAGGVERFADLYMTALLDAGMPQAALARERVLGLNAGRWVVEWEAARRSTSRRVLLERSAELAIDIDGEPFVLTAKADRIEVTDGRLSVIDFKTGSAPTAKQVETGFSSQLPLTAAIACAGGFGPEGAGEPHELLYVSVTGREPPARIEDRAGEEGASATTDAAMDGLIERVRDYRRLERAYASRTAPAFAQRSVSDYDHLARVAEWSTSGEEEGE